MRLSLWVTTSVVLSLGTATLLESSTSSPVTLALVIVGVNVAIWASGRAVPRRRTAPASSQHRMMSLVEQTLPHLRLGLNPETAMRTARLLKDTMRLDAVGITDREQVLAFVGMGEDHHVPGSPIDAEVTRRAVDSKDVLVATKLPSAECNGRSADCPLSSVVVAPLVCGDHSVGSLKVYHREPPYGGLIELARGLADILSLQLELALAQREAEVAEAAKLDALRAQMNPHFLFNTLNTISMKARTDPEEARKLLVKLSDFLRYAMKRSAHKTLFSEEYFFVRTYLFLEKARFGDRLKVRYDVDPQCLSIPVPPLVIQPLVENAVKHGIGAKPEGGLIELKARLEPIGGSLRIRVGDNGVGIPTDRLSSLLRVQVKEVSALANIHERLTRMYGGRASMDVTSAVGKGTEVSLSLPIT